MATPTAQSEPCPSQPPVLRIREPRAHRRDGMHLQQTGGRLVVCEVAGAVETLDADRPSHLPMVMRVLADHAGGRQAFVTLDE